MRAVVAAAETRYSLEVVAVGAQEQMAFSHKVLFHLAQALCLPAATEEMAVAAVAVVLLPQVLPMALMDALAVVAMAAAVAAVLAPELLIPRIRYKVDQEALVAEAVAVVSTHLV
jgi:hypothetical protein